MHTTNETFATIAIGASAGNQDALREFFSEIPENIDACFVVVLHLSRDYPSQMTSIISKFTKLRVVRATEGCVLQPGTVYVMPENVTMQVKNNILHLRPRADAKVNFAIDNFLSAMAQDYTGVNVAVILSGMGTDGTQGAIDIYRNGGHVLVQDPASTEFKGMPKSVIANDHPEMVSNPRELGIAVMNIVNDIYHPD